MLCWTPALISHYMVDMEHIMRRKPERSHNLTRFSSNRRSYERSALYFRVIGFYTNWSCYMAIIFGIFVALFRPNLPSPIIAHIMMQYFTLRHVRRRQTYIASHKTGWQNTHEDSHRVGDMESQIIIINSKRSVK